MAFAEKMKEIRAQKKLSQADLEKRSGVSQSAISAIERGDRSPTEETMKMLAAGLRVPLSDLLSEEKKPIAETDDELRKEINGLLDDLREDEQVQARDYLEWILSRRGK